MYKQSFYNIIERNSNKKVVLFNTRTGGIVVPTNSDNNKLIKILEMPNRFPNHDPLKMELIKYQFLVANNFNELDTIKKSHEKSINKPSSSLECVIIPTKLCNFGCPYCYVKNPKNTIMGDTVYSKIYTYITQKVIISKKKFRDEKIQLHVTWFGGEPTLELKKILEFMNDLMFFAKKHDVQMSSSMTTNGYLLNYELFKKFVSKRIIKFQITLDGYANTHDRGRYLKKNKQGTFNKIYSNLLEIQKKSPPDIDFRIIIRTNITKSNIENMELFRKQIQEDFKDKRISHWFSPVCKYNNKDETVNSNLFSDHDGLCQSCSLNMENNIHFFKNHSINEMHKALPKPKDSPCIIHKDIYTILPNGEITACSIVDANHSIGKLNSNGNTSFNKNFSFWKKSIFQDKSTFDSCYKCNLLPICMGGCKYSILCNPPFPKCDMIEDNIRKILKLYLNEYLKKDDDIPLVTTILGAKIPY